MNNVRRNLEVLNDLDREIFHLFNVMIDRQLGGNLLDRLLKLNHCESNFVLAKRAQANYYRGIGDIQRAEMIFTIITQSFNAIRRHYRHGVSQYAYHDELSRHLPLVYERLAGVRMMSHDATYVLDKVRNNKNAFIFADLPYLHDLRANYACNVYGKEMSRREHIRFLESARDARCAIMVCGYRQEDGGDLYDRYLLGHGNWNHYLLAELLKSCQPMKARTFAREWIWVNYPLPEHARYYIDKNSANSL